MDPEVVALAGISEEELERYRSPVAYEDKSGAVPQPAFDSERPWMRDYPKGVYQKIVVAPDEVIAAQAAPFADPPLKVED